MAKSSEPGGPQTHESMRNIFRTQIGIIQREWGKDVEAVRGALKTLGDTFPDTKKDGDVYLFSTRAVQWYEVPTGSYRRDTYYLDGVMRDEPLAPDGRGPHIVGEIVGVRWHEVPGTPGIGWDDDPENDSNQISAPLVPGILIANASMEEPNDIDPDVYAFVPLLFMTDPEAQVLTVNDSSSGGDISIRKNMNEDTRYENVVVNAPSDEKRQRKYAKSIMRECERLVIRAGLKVRSSLIMIFRNLLRESHLLMKSFTSC